MNRFPFRVGWPRNWTLHGIFSFVFVPSWILPLCFVVLHPTYSAARNPISVICDSAARIASESTGVPISVLRAISLTETGRKSGGVFEPWPWTVNMEGKGVWFDNRHEALDYVGKNFDRGARSFDVGCFQLNYKWHGQAFSSIEEMFDPEINATYAANFLLDLYREKGNWPDAAGAYHSRTPKYAQRYIRRFKSLLADMSDAPPAAPLSTEPFENPLTIADPKLARINRFPLLQGNGAAHASLGSLMPADAGADGIRLFGG